MKRIYYFSLLFLIFASCKQTKQSDINEDAKAKFIALNVQYAKTYEYEFRFGEVDTTSGFLIELVEFNKNGNPIRREKYHRSKYLKEYDEINIYSYDSENKLSETIRQNDSGVIKSIVREKYDNNQNTERVFYNNDGVLTGKASYKYDKDGNCIELISYDESGKIKYKTSSKYGANNKLIEQKQFDNKGKIESSFKVLENKDGSAETHYYDENNELKYKSIYIFGENKLVKSLEWIDIKDDNSSKTEYKYDENNLLIEETEYENNGEPKSIEKTVYIKFQ